MLKGMQESPLLSRQCAAGATPGEYRGAQVALRLPKAEATAFQSAALCDWSWRARLAIAGAEARKWLNGVVSANVRDLRPGQAVASFFLDPKGHALHQFDLVALTADSFLVLCDQAAIGDLSEKLIRYRLRAQAEITDQSAVGGSIALSGPEAAAVLSRAGVASLPPLAGAWSEATISPGASALLLRWSWGGVDTFELLLDPPSMGGVWDRLREAGALAVGAEAQERERILRGVARPGVDLRATDLASESGLLHAVGLNKGCYIGQEIVERIRARGAVHRELRNLRFTGPVSPGAKVTAAGREVGEITSATLLAEGGSAALGYIRREAVEGTLECEGQTGTVLASPSPESH